MVAWLDDKCWDKNYTGMLAPVKYVPDKQKRLKLDKSWIKINEPQPRLQVTHSWRVKLTRIGFGVMEGTL